MTSRVTSRMTSRVASRVTSPQTFPNVGRAIYIKSIAPGGAAARERRVRAGDRLTMVQVRGGSSRGPVRVRAARRP
jgi:hypothetical protein